MLLVYQLKAGLCLVAFYLLWKLLLSRDTLHRFNRVLLLVVTALALVLPWVRLSVERPSAVGQGFVDIEELVAVAVMAPEPQPADGWAWVRLAYIIYIIGVAVLVAWRAYALLALRRLLRQGRAEWLADGAVVHVLPTDVAPFSYFSHIVIGERDYAETPSEILTHEMAHIRLGHSIDLLFMDAVLLLQWWNPAAWLLRRELKQVHEYEADEAVLQRGVDARQYQLLLIRKSVGDQLFSMANNLNYQSLKKRIRMMTTRKSSRWQQLRALTVVPVAALAVVAFASPKVNEVATRVEQAVAAPDHVPEVVVTGYAPVQPVPIDTVTVRVPSSVETVAPFVVADDNPDVYDMVEQMPEFPGGAPAMMQFLAETVKYPAEAQAEGQEGRVIATFVVEPDGTVSEPTIVRGISPSLDEEALRVISAMPRWTPGTHKGQAVRVKYTIPISFRLQGETGDQMTLRKSDAPEKQLLVIVDGQELTAAALNGLDADDIVNIDVLKDEATLAKYGERGKNGVIIVTTRQK